MISAAKALVIVMMVLFMALINKKIVKPLIMRSRLIKQGVVFLKSPILAEVTAIVKYKETHPFMPVFCTMSAEILKQEGRKPKVTGYCLPG